MFSDLLYNIEKQNPVVFQLPKKLRERYAGVSTGEFGKYENGDMKHIVNTGFGPIDSYNSAFLSLRDKKGDPVLCYHCHKSVIHGPMQTCDYCSTNFHLDCLNPPLTSKKTIGKKWKCPLHSDEFLDKRGNNRKTRQTKIIDVALRRGFKNNGDIEILSDNEEAGTLDYVEPIFQVKGPKKRGHIFVPNDIENEINAVGFEKPIYHPLDVPPFFSYEDTRTGVKANIPKQNQKDYGPNSGIIYRLPERGIILDFLEAVTKNREQKLFEKSEALVLPKCQYLSDAFESSTSLINPTESEQIAVEKLISLNQEQSNDSNDLKEIVKTLFALEAKRKEDKSKQKKNNQKQKLIDNDNGFLSPKRSKIHYSDFALTPPHSSIEELDFEEYDKIQLKNIDIDSNELVQLMLIKKMMLEKGKRDLLKFLSA